jgi:hypothetical protein
MLAIIETFNSPPLPCIAKMREGKESERERENDIVTYCSKKKPIHLERGGLVYSLIERFLLRFFRGCMS